ncbi:MAG: AAA family ATPase [Proteobacteria bacterium]|nr:AAA family ATPase [Pseudomonadota bacterium]
MFEVETSSNVVIIAGANGSGKTRLKEALVNTFRSPNNPLASLSISATRDKEEAAWGRASFDVTVDQPCSILRDYLTTRTGTQAYTGTIIQIDSDRAVQPVKFELISLATVDPDDEDVNYNYYLNPFINRWQQLVNKIYKKAANRDQKIAKFTKENPDKLGIEALKKFPDTFLSYQEMFTQLLPDKTLEPIDPKSPREFYYRVTGSDPMPFTSLSSGEQEVVRVVFDLVWKRITHSIILVDEPELHLHPTLAFRLIETLKEFGGGTNQLILFTHSADLISTYYSSGNVFFIDLSQDTENQAHQLSDLATAHSAIARAAGANLGLFAVGKRLVFVEGKDASVDRLVYHKVAQSAFPDAYMMPIGSVENIVALRKVVDELTSAIFGIDFFLIRDRDGLSEEIINALEKNGRFRCLPRRHIENYLLDPEVLGEVANAFYLPQEQRDVSRIQEFLRGIASSSIMPSVLWNVREHIQVLGKVPQPIVRNLDGMSRDELAENISDQITIGLREVSQGLESSEIHKLVVKEHGKLEAALSTGSWVEVLPGKLIFNRFCGEFSAGNSLMKGREGLGRLMPISL